MIKETVIPSTVAGGAVTGTVDDLKAQLKVPLDLVIVLVDLIVILLALLFLGFKLPLLPKKSG